MLGSICGDILGSTYEFGIENQDIFLLHENDDMTDDSVLTCAVAEWLVEYGTLSGLGKGEHQYILARKFFDYTMRYPDKAYGLKYMDWILTYEERGTIPEPPDSLGNGCAMRVSPIAYAYKTLHEVEAYACLQAEVTHNNPEGIRGACAIAAATKMALDGRTKNEIKKYISSKYFYNLNQTIESIRSVKHEFSPTCPVTVPQALIAFLEGTD